VIPGSWKRPVPSSISIKVSGKDNLLDAKILCSPPTRRLGFKRVTVSILPFHPPQEDRLSSSMSTSARGAWVYLAAWDLRRAKLFGRCVRNNGIEPLDDLIGEVMSQEPYRSAARVFWILDNCSLHRGQKCVQRLQARWPSIVPVHTPIHASWLNQVEIYLSIVQRKVLTPNDFDSLDRLEVALLGFQQRYGKVRRSVSMDLHAGGLGKAYDPPQRKGP